LITGGPDGLRVSETSGQPAHRLVGPTGLVDAVAWSPDSTRIFTGSRDGVRVWDATTGNLVHQPPGHSARVLAWSHDGTRLASGGPDGAIVWDVTRGEPLHRRLLHGHTSGAEAVAWSPDDTRLLTGGRDGARVWDAITGETIHRLSGNACWVQAVAWSPDDTRLVTSGPDGVEIWEATTGEFLFRLKGHIAWIHAVAWSPDGSRLVTGDIDGTIRAWHSTDGRPAASTISILPESEFALFDGTSEQIIGVSVGAWRWLGWNIVEDGNLVRIPAESFGPLPQLPTALDNETTMSKSAVGTYSS
jgi:WD40 repeat protein